MSSLNLQRSIEKAKRDGYMVWVVERFISHPPHGSRIDLFNLFDAVAIRKGEIGVLGIQACTHGDLQVHIKKVREGYVDKKGLFVPANPYLSTWKASQNRAVIWAWGLRSQRDEQGNFLKNKDGSRKMDKRWVCIEEVL